MSEDLINIALLEHLVANQRKSQVKSMFSNLHLKSFIRVIVKLKWLFTAFCSKYHPMSVGRKHERETRKKLSRKGRRKKVLGSNGTLKNKIFTKGEKKQESPCGLLIAF
jgi:hypothetical protein